MLTIYHNPRCKKSRAGLKYIEDKNLEVKIIKYLTEGISKEKLIELLNKLNKTPLELIRKQEPVYKQKIKSKDLSDDELIQKMIENPKLIHRPIVETDKKAVLGDPPEKINEIL